MSVIWASTWTRNSTSGRISTRRHKPAETTEADTLSAWPRRYRQSGRHVHTVALDYCNALLAALPQSTMAPLQRVMDAAARLVCNLRSRDHVTPALIELHWLPITARVQYKLCLLVHSATLYPDFLDARNFALRIADSSTSHALHCRRAVFEPSRMLVHLCGTLCPFISRTAI